MRTNRKQVWIEIPTGEAPIRVEVSARLRENLRHSRSPVAAIASTALGGKRSGTLKLTLPRLWSTRAFGRFKVALGGPEFRLTRSGFNVTAASLAVTTIGTAGPRPAVKVSVRIDHMSRPLLRVGSRLFRRWMPLVGLGVHLRFLHRDYKQAMTASRASSSRLEIALAWVRVAGDLAAIPFPVVGMATETAVWVAELARKKDRAVETQS